MVDPLNAVGNIIDGITDIVELDLFVSCSEDTRVILRPEINVTLPNITVVLKIENCTVYWKDIQKLSNYAGIENLILVDWTDEFETNSDGYFNECVNLTRSTWSSLKTLTDSKSISYISGLLQVGGLLVTSKMLRTVGPVFTRYQWPRVAELVFRG